MSVGCHGCLDGFGIVGVSTLGVPGLTSKIVVACPSPDGLARDETRRGENLGSCYPAPEWVRLQ
jgi:hypothetical protein